MPALRYLYESDLAHVHIDGYRFHWESAVLEWLRAAGVRGGTVVSKTRRYRRTSEVR